MKTPWWEHIAFGLCVWLVSSVAIGALLLATKNDRCEQIKASRDSWRETAIDAADTLTRCVATSRAQLETLQALVKSKAPETEKLNEYPFSKNALCPVGSWLVPEAQRGGVVEYAQCATDAGRFTVWRDSDTLRHWFYQPTDPAGSTFASPTFPDDPRFGPPPGSVTLNNSGSVTCNPGAPNCHQNIDLTGCEPTTLRPEDSHDGVINAVGRVKCPPRATRPLWDPLDGGATFVTAPAFSRNEPRNVFYGSVGRPLFAAWTDGGYALNLDTGQRVTFNCGNGAPAMESYPDAGATLFCWSRPTAELVSCDLVYRTNGMQRCTRADGGTFELRR